MSDEMRMIKLIKNMFQNAYFARIVMIRAHGIKSPFCYDI